MGMVPTKVNDTNVLDVWRRMNSRQYKSKPVRFTVGQTVRISKEKIKFAKDFEQLYPKEVFKLTTVMCTSPQPVYKIENL